MKCHLTTDATQRSGTDAAEKRTERNGCLPSTFGASQDNEQDGADGVCYTFQSISHTVSQSQPNQSVSQSSQSVSQSDVWNCEQVRKNADWPRSWPIDKQDSTTEWLMIGLAQCCRVWRRQLLHKNAPPVAGCAVSHSCEPRQRPGAQPCQVVAAHHSDTVCIAGTVSEQGVWSVGK